MTQDRSTHPHRKRRVVLAVLVVIVVLVAGCALALTWAVGRRQEEERLGIGAVSEPGITRALEDSSGRTGAFTTEIEFTTMADNGGGRVATEVAWDDEWFFQDPTVYNHELATTCSVLSAVANAESAYFQEGSTVPAYAENALAALGFEEISTASYRYRSEIWDEIVDFFTGSDDVVAYSLATKHITSATGATKTLYLVSIRGSYGSEWLSDVNMGDAAAYQMEDIDHEGFMRSANEIIDDLAARITEEAQDTGTDDIALLFCGHSRGAATANLAASYADDMTESLRPLAPLGSIYCYTFATPEVTTMPNTGDALYNNIFNIMNPSDLVPRLPLASWGYARYGHDLWLPGAGDAVFDERYDAMRAAFKANTGAESPYVPEDRARVDQLVDDLGHAIPTQDDLASAGGIASLVRDVVADVNPMQVLYGHYPNVYIAWMQAIEAGDLAG